MQMVALGEVCGFPLVFKGANIWVFAQCEICWSFSDCLTFNIVETCTSYRRAAYWVFANCPRHPMLGFAGCQSAMQLFSMCFPIQFSIFLPFNPFEIYLVFIAFHVQNVLGFQPLWVFDTEQEVIDCGV